jgi:hypothetical protein
LSKATIKNFFSVLIQASFALLFLFPRQVRVARGSRGEVVRPLREAGRVVQQHRSTDEENEEKEEEEVSRNGNRKRNRKSN